MHEQRKVCKIQMYTLDQRSKAKWHGKCIGNESIDLKVIQVSTNEKYNKNIICLPVCFCLLAHGQNSPGEVSDSASE